MKIIKRINQIIKNIKNRNKIYECEWCEKEFSYKDKRDNLWWHEFYNPFESLPSETIRLCENCSNETYEVVECCETCDRYIYQHNGYRINIRYDDKHDEFVCVSCLQEKWLEKGMKSFKDADFFNYSDLTENGFNKISSHFCRNEQSYKDVEKSFNCLKEKGKKVIVNIDSSGLGLEHYISLYMRD